METKLLEVKEKYNLDFLDLYCVKDDIGDFNTDYFLRLIIGNNNRFNMRDMENRVVTDKVFDEIMDMIPGMIIELNEIIQEGDNEKQ